MSWIELHDDRGFLGKFNLPPTIEDAEGNVFSIGYAVKRGGNGVVFESRRKTNSGTAMCAIKMLRRLDSQRRDRFANEVRILNALDHPRISRCFGYGTLQVPAEVGNIGSERTVYLEVPWVAIELGSINLRQQIDDNGPLPVKQLVPVLLDMCDALHHLHSRDLIHRDIKPDNFVWDSTKTNVTMIDFGIAKYVGEDVSARPLDQFTQHLEFVGPVFFSSPELIAYARDKAHPVDRRSDLFQLGKVAWFLATGRISAGIPNQKLCPFGGALWDILLRLLSDDPADRPTDAQQVRDLFAALPIRDEA